MNPLTQVMLPKEPCFKITNREETHHGYKYKDGLNILNGEFNDKLEDKCGAGGFYFTTRQYINRFYSYGIYLREVTIPSTDPDFKIIECQGILKWRANKIILGAKYSLFDPETYNKFELDIWANKNIIEFAGQYGRIDFLEHLKNMNNTWDNNYDFVHINNMIIAASKHNQLAFLEWIKKEGFIYRKFIATNAVVAGCENGHYNVVEWWSKTTAIIDYALIDVQKIVANKYYDLLDWLIKNSKIRYPDSSFIRQCISTNDMTILHYWYEHGLVQNNMDKLCYSEIFVAENSKEILEFLHKNNLINHDDLMLGIPEQNNISILNLLKNSGIKLDTAKIMDNASKHGYINVLEWVKNNSDQELQYTTKSLLNASLENNLEVLNWWLASELELKYDTDVLVKVMRECDKSIIAWWVELLQVDGRIDTKYLLTK